MFDKKSILVTGGTGSFGRLFCQEVLKNYNPSRLIVYSRDEYKQAIMMEDPVFRKSPAIRFFLGDIRDKERLIRAMSGVDIVVHAAALKQVPAAEYNPHEFIKTNIYGATNVVDAALYAEVSKVIAVSTDKAVNPINLYGATKLCFEKVIIAANSYSGRKGTRFSVVRYGNVLGSRGSVIPSFLEQRKAGEIRITDPRMTRFYITLSDGVAFVCRCIDRMVGGELFVPKAPSCRITDLVEAVAPGFNTKVVGIRPGEKIHEILIPQDEAYRTVEFDDHFIVEPVLPFWEGGGYLKEGRPCDESFSYSSETNTQWFTIEELRSHANRIAEELALEGVQPKKVDNEKLLHSRSRDRKALPALLDC